MDIKQWAKLNAAGECIVNKEILYTQSRHKEKIKLISCNSISIIEI